MPGQKFLLHICCAPCATHVLALLSGGFELAGYFFNPNIHPGKEYALRLAHAVQHLRGSGTPLIKSPYQPREWFAAVRNMEREPEGGTRCASCIRMRLEETARVASSRGFDIFGTTLSISPHKDVRLINRIGEECAARHGIRFHAADFKKSGGYKESCRMSRELGLYRQDYCGCIFSLMERKRRRQAHR